MLLEKSAVKFCQAVFSNIGLIVFIIDFAIFVAPVNVVEVLVDRKLSFPDICQLHFAVIMHMTNVLI